MIENRISGISKMWRAGLQVDESLVLDRKLLNLSHLAPKAERRKKHNTIHRNHIYVLVFDFIYENSLYNYKYQMFLLPETINVQFF